MSAISPRHIPGQNIFPADFRDFISPRTRRIIFWSVLTAHFTIIVCPFLWYLLISWLKPQNPPKLIKIPIMEISGPDGLHQPDRRSPIPSDPASIPNPEQLAPLPPEPQAEPQQPKTEPQQPKPEIQQPKAEPKPSKAEPKPPEIKKTVDTPVKPDKEALKPKVEPTPKPKLTPQQIRDASVVKREETQVPETAPVKPDKETTKPKEESAKPKLTPQQIRDASVVKKGEPLKTPATPTSKPGSTSTNQTFKDFKNYVYQGDPPSNPGGGPNPGGSSKSADLTDDQKNEYFSRLRGFLYDHWQTPPKSQLNGSKPTVDVQITIDAGGRITGFSIVSKSGNLAMDNSVERLFSEVKVLPAPPMAMTFTVTITPEE